MKKLVLGFTIFVLLQFNSFSLYAEKIPNEECDLTSAKVQISEKSIESIQALDPSIKHRLPCIIDIKKHFLDDDYLIREVYITGNKKWLIVLSGTGVLGMIHFINLNSNQLIKKTYLDQIKILNENSIQFFTRKNCQTATLIQFQNGKFTTKKEMPYESCDF